MGPLNKKEIYTAYKTFVFQFVLLLVFMLCGVFFYMKAADREYTILREKHEEIEALMASRVEINQQFNNINQRFKELNSYTTAMSDQAKKRILQTDIERSAGTINNLLSQTQAKEERASFLLYRKLNQEVSSISRLQDSLFTTKNIIESQRMQLRNCIEQNNRATEQLSRRGARRR